MIETVNTMLNNIFSVKGLLGVIAGLIFNAGYMVWAGAKDNNMYHQRILDQLEAIESAILLDK